jgi:DNA-binding LacI/PurR family transcriptional regulator
MTFYFRGYSMRPAKFTGIAEEFASQITERRIPRGCRLPSQSQLVKKYGVSRSCIQKALDLLAEQGLVEKRPGRGTFVQDDAAPSSRLQTVGLLLPEGRFKTTLHPFDNFGLEILWGIEEIVRKSEANLVMRRLDESETDRIASIGRQMEADGLLIYRWFDDEAVRQACASGIPVAVVGRMTEVDGVSASAPACREGFAETVAMLHQDGVRRIGFLHASAKSDLPERLYDAEMVEALRTAERTLPGLRIDWLDYWPSSAGTHHADLEEGAIRETLNRLLADRALPEVFLCCSDWTLLHALNALKKRDVAVPSQVRMLGFYGLQMGEMIEPYFSTLAVDAREIGCRAVEALRATVESGAPARIERVPLRFIERETYRRPANREARNLSELSTVRCP